jgi:hypothetical protein
MKKFIQLTTGFILLFISIVFLLLIISSSYVKNKGFKNYTTESNTLWLTKDVGYDLLFMGISHARNFSRHKNHLRIEEILDSKIANIGQGSGICGSNEQLFYLDYFYSKGNKASQIIYILSPPLLFSQTLPISTNTFKYEAFEFSFLKRYLSFQSENKNGRIMAYLQRKLNPKWFFNKPFTLERMEKKLDSLDTKKVKRGQDLAYSGSKLDFKRFNESTKIIEETVKLAKKNNSKIIFIIPPALFGKWRGHKETSDFAKSIINKYPNVKLFDGSEKVLSPGLYFDNHHLNTEGVVFFTEKYLKALIQ